MKKITLIVVIAALLMLALASAVQASNNWLYVDGALYAPTHVSGPVFHYETPDSNPTDAFSNRHEWTGNGSEWLPCPNGIHWVDNKNRLVISNCLETSTTTSTIPKETTTTENQQTTTTVADTTSTTIRETTTTTVRVDSTTTVIREETTTTVSVPQVTLPYTGMGTAILTGMAISALLAGTLILMGVWRRDE